MGVWLWPGNKAAVYAMEDAILSTTKKSTPSSHSNIKSMLIIFLDIQGIVHKEFVPPGQPVNGKFYCEVLRQLRENVRRKRPEMWKNRNWLLHHDNALHTPRSLWGNSSQKIMWPLFPTLPTHLTWPPAISTCFLKWNSGWKGDISPTMKRSKQNHNRY